MEFQISRRAVCMVHFRDTQIQFDFKMVVLQIPEILEKIVTSTPQGYRRSNVSVKRLSKI